MANPLVDIFRVKELRDRILFTIGLLFVYRLGCVLPVPGINIVALKNYFATAGSGLGIEEFLDFFAGGAFKNFSIFMMNIMPYISSSIIIQLLTIVFPKLKKIQEEEGGKKKVKAWTRYGTVAICLIQSYTVVTYANSIPDAINIGKIPFALLAMLTTTTGTMFLVWMGDQITRRGIGNGTSIIIFAGIVARIPGAFLTLAGRMQDQANPLNPVYVIIALLMFVVVVALVIMEQQGQRKIPVHYAKRVVGRRVYGAANTYLPFKVNPSGVIPVIFASSILVFPLQIVRNLAPNVEWLSKVSSFLDPNRAPYIIMYTLLIIFFAYFYTQVTLNPVEIAKHIRENGGSIPGIRSEKMEEYLQRILYRIMLPGSLFLAFIAVIPTLVQILFKFPSSVAYLMGGTSLLILVGVDLDTMSQVEGYLRMHHHDGIVRKGKIRSRNL